MTSTPSSFARLLIVPFTLLACTSEPGSEAGETAATSSDTGADSTSEAGTETGTETGDETGDETTGEPEPTRYDEPGPFAVGNLEFELADPDGVRPLRVELWYPADEGARAAAEQGQPLLAFEPDEPEAAALAGLVAAAPDACVRKQTRSAAAPERAAVAGPWPTVVFSHCHGCARFSSYSLAERLASHGFLVAAVDHAGSTWHDNLVAELPPLNFETLSLRRDDVVRVIDELLDPAAASLPPAFVGLADADRLGVFGHSFGAVTTGIVLQDDPRPKAGVAIAAPIESPIWPGVSMTAIGEPLMLMVAVEDNSITEIGNNLIRTNFSNANLPVWKLELADTGHFGVSDLAGLSDYFAAGCGEGTRQTNDEPFTYADPFAVRELTAGRVAAFFGLYLLGDADARAQLEAADPLVDVAVRE